MFFFMGTFHRVKKEIGNAVLAICNNKCTNCGKEKDLCIHHIIKMQPDNEEYNNIENLTVLCRSCHMSHHRKEGDVIPPISTHGNPYGRRGKTPPIKCIILNCCNFQHGRSLCKKHYEYRRRKGLFVVSKSKNQS